jgi:predicted MFS family arabinose efflux permease
MSTPPTAKPSYAAVLRTPQALRTFGSALLAAKNATGSYAAAGLAMAVYGACAVLFGPARAGLVDRYGPRRALVPLAGAFAALLVVLGIVCWEPGVPAPLVAALAGLAGSCCPPLGPTMRVLWGRLVPGRAMLQRAYSLDGVVEELLYVTGPLMVSIPVVYAYPSIGVLAAAALVLTGTLAMVTSPVAAHTDAPAGKSAGRTRARRIPGIGLPTALAAAVGLTLGGIGLLGIAFTESHGRPEAISWVEASLAVGSAVGGLVYGMIGWRSGARDRLLVIACLLGCALAAAGFSPGVYVLAPAVAVVGLFIAPAITTAYLIADEAAAPGTRARAGAWVNTALNAGTSVGTAVVGLLVGRLPLTLCYVLVAVPVLCAAATALALRDRKRGQGQGQGPGQGQDQSSESVAARSSAALSAPSSS